MNVPNRKLELTIIAIISLAFIFWGGAFIYRSSFIAVDGRRYFCLFDDAMVSMRYAWNFSHDRGLVYNPGQFVQGYTNLLMVLWMSVATLVFDKSWADLFVQLSGVGFMLVIAWAAMKISDHLVQGEAADRRMLVRILSFFCALAYYPLSYWSLMGMETGLLTMLLLLAILFTLDYARDKKPALLLAVALCLGLAYLTRNDSLLFAIIVFFYIAWGIYKSTKGSKAFSVLFPALGIYILFVVGQAIFQYTYYGEWLPNTYTLKLTGMPLLFRLRDGVGFVTPFVLEIALVLVLAMIDLVFNFRRQKLFLLSMLFIAVIYQVYVGGDPWNYWRIMSPSIPLLLILFVISVTAVMDWLSARTALSNFFHRLPDRFGGIVVNALIVVFVMSGLTLTNLRFWPEISLRENNQVESNQKNVNTAIALELLTTQDATTGLFWAGAIPYFTDRMAYDMLGKTDRYIARLPPDLSGSVSLYGMKSVPGHNKYDLNYSIITLQPTFVQGFNWGDQDLTQWAGTRYVEVKCSGVRISLLKKSPSVIWSRITKGLIYYCS